MARINDVGGMQGFGPIDTADDTEPFHADWEARVFALNSALIAGKVYNLDEFRDAIESMAPADYLAASYYERWFFAIRKLLERKGVIEAGELDV
jgi:nitrile hydratase